MPADTVNSTEPYLRVDAVSKTFGSIRALDRADFEVGHGEVMALVGENGAGKSTLVKILAGMYPPDEGRIRLGGNDVQFGGSTQSEHAGIAVVQQELSLVPSLLHRRQRLLGRHETRVEELASISGPSSHALFAAGRSGRTGPPALRSSISRSRSAS